MPGQLARQIAKKVRSIASLPQVYQRVTEVIDHPRSSTADIGKIIMDDPGLSSRLLRIANSAFYGFPGKVDTVTRAVTLIGTGQVKDLALATSVVSAFRKVPQDLVNMETFWRHSIACGLCCRALAQRRRMGNVERFFVGGLMHDIGSLVLYVHEPEKALQALEKSKSGQLLDEAEKELIGADHAEVGAALLAEWQLPETFIEPTEFHHRPSVQRIKEPVPVALAHVAEIVATGLGLGHSGSPLVPPLDPEAWVRLGMQPIDLRSIADTVEEQYDEAVELFGARDQK